MGFPVKFGLRVARGVAGRLVAEAAPLAAGRSGAVRDYFTLWTDPRVWMAARRAKNPFDWARVLIRDALLNPTAEIHLRFAAIEKLFPHRAACPEIATALARAANQGPGSPLQQAARLALGEPLTGKFERLSSSFRNHIEPLARKLGNPGRFAETVRLETARSAEAWLGHEPVRRAFEAAARDDPHTTVKTFAQQALARYQGPNRMLGGQASDASELTARLGQVFDGKGPLRVTSQTTLRTSHGQVTRSNLQGRPNVFGRVVSGTLDPEYIDKGHLRGDLAALAEASRRDPKACYFLLAPTATEGALRAARTFFRGSNGAAAPARLVLLGRLRGSGEDWLRIVATPGREPTLHRLTFRQVRRQGGVGGPPGGGQPLRSVIHPSVREGPLRPYGPRTRQ